MQLAEVRTAQEILVKVDRKRAVVVAPDHSHPQSADVEWVRVHDVQTAGKQTYVTTPYGVWVTDGRQQVRVRQGRG